MQNIESNTLSYEILPELTNTLMPNNKTVNTVRQTLDTSSKNIASNKSCASRSISSIEQNNKNLSEVFWGSLNNKDQKQMIINLKNISSQYSYDEYKKWIFSKQFNLSQFLCLYNNKLITESGPIEYAYNLNKKTIAKTIIAIMEKKHLQEHGINAKNFGWITCRSANEMYLLQIALYLLQDTGVNLKPLSLYFHKHSVLLKYAIEYTIQKELPKSLINLFSISTKADSILNTVLDSLDYSISNIIKNKNISLLNALFYLLTSPRWLIECNVQQAIKTNDYLVFREFMPYLDINENLEMINVNNMTILIIEALEAKCNNTALFAISCSGKINLNESAFKDAYEDDTYYINNHIWCLPPLFKVIYNKDFNMIDILLALGAKRFDFDTILSIINKYLAQEYKPAITFTKEDEEYISNKLTTPSSLATISSVNIAKKLTVKMYENKTINLNTIKNYLTDFNPTKMIKKINTIEDLFSINLLLKG